MRAEGSFRCRALCLASGASLAGADVASARVSRVAAVERPLEYVDCRSV